MHHGTIAIDEVERETGIDVSDKVIAGGRQYIAVTPGVAFLAIASYWPYAALIQPKLGGLPPELELKVSQYVMAWSTTIPAAALATAVIFLMLRVLGVEQIRSAIFACLFYAGTPVVFYSLNLTNGQNIVEMALLLSSWLVLALDQREPAPPPPHRGTVARVRVRGRWLLVAAGALQGLAVFVNMSAVVVLPAVAVYLWLVRRRNVLAWVGGLLPGLVALQVYNSLAFGRELTAYHISYRGWVPPASLLGSWDITRELLLGWRIGLLFFCPLVILAWFMPRDRFRSAAAWTITASVALYVVAYSLMLQVFKVQQAGPRWFLTTGGGGPRYLLPIVPVVIVLAALTDLGTTRRRNLAVTLAVASVLINLPGLFWTGGEPWVLNNLLLWLKNGFHSYTIETLREVFAAWQLNTARLSMAPAFTLLLAALWWIWDGRRRCADALAGRSPSR